MANPPPVAPRLSLHFMGSRLERPQSHGGFFVQTGTIRDEIDRLEDLIIPATMSAELVALFDELRDVLVRLEDEYESPEGAS